MNGKIERRYASLFFGLIQKSGGSYLFEGRLLIVSRHGGPLQFISEPTAERRSTAVFVRTHLPSNLS
jgi:hypothetical protein